MIQATIPRPAREVNWGMRMCSRCDIEYAYRKDRDRGLGNLCTDCAEVVHPELFGIDYTLYVPDGPLPDHNRRAERAAIILAAGYHPVTRRPLGGIDGSCGECIFQRYSTGSNHRVCSAASSNTRVNASMPACDIFERNA